MNSSAPNGVGAVDSGFLDIVAEGGRGAEDFPALCFDSGTGAGGEDWLGNTGVPITFKAGSGSGSPVCLELESEDDVS